MQCHVFGADHPVITDSIGIYAKQYQDRTILYLNEGHYEDAVLVGGQFLSMLQRVLGMDRPGLTQSFARLVDAALTFSSHYWQEGHPDKAVRLSEMCILWQRQTLGNDHPDLAVSLKHLGSIYWYQERYKDAGQLYEEALVIESRVLEDRHPTILHCLSNLRAIYRRLVDFYKNTAPDTNELPAHLDALEDQYKKLIVVEEEILGTDHHDLTYTLMGLQALYSVQHRDDEAALVAERVSALSKKRWKDAEIRLLDEIRIMNEAETVLQEAWEIDSTDPSEPVEQQERESVPEGIAFLNSVFSPLLDATV